VVVAMEAKGREKRVGARFEQPWLDTESPRAAGGAFPESWLVTSRPGPFTWPAGWRASPVTPDSQ